MVFNTTFNNISVISWGSVLLVEEIRVTRENHRPIASQGQTLSQNVVSSTPLHEGCLNSQQNRRVRIIVFNATFLDSLKVKDVKSNLFKK